MESLFLASHVSQSLLRQQRAVSGLVIQSLSLAGHTTCTWREQVDLSLAGDLTNINWVVGVLIVKQHACWYVVRWILCEVL